MNVNITLNTSKLNLNLKHLYLVLNMENIAIFFKTVDNFILVHDQWPA